MKREKWLSCLTGAGLAFGIGLAGMGCLASAFDIENVSMVAVVAICAGCAVIPAVCFTLRRAAVMPVAAAALLIGFLLREGTMLLHLEVLLFRISSYYDMAYGWGVIRWSGRELVQVPVTGALGLLGGIVALCVVWAVCRRKGAFLAAVAGFLPLAACFVVTDSIPDERWIFLLMLCLGLLLLTQQVRRTDPRAGVRLTAMLLIPAILASMLLFWLNPRKDYQSRVEGLQNKVMNWIGDLPFIVTTPDGNLTITLDGTGGDRLDLSRVGPKTLQQYPVMDVVAQTGGVIYLRGQSLDIYSGTGWSASEVSTGKDMFFPEQNMEQIGRLTVSMRMSHSRKYIPYYISDDYEMTDGTVDNEGGLREYGYWVMAPMAGYKHISDSVTVDVNRPILHQCLQLPAETRAAAEAILDEILASLPMPRDTIFYDDTTQKAELIRDYVQDSARYSLNTPAMPENEKDFAIWFLTQSQTGYCVHFASALTVLLRAAGIPARYVTGYTFEAIGGTKTVVRAAQAHAWVEYMDPDTGWTVVDATPSEWMEEQETEPANPATEPEETEPTEPETEPEPTEDATQPSTTEPEDTTEATAPNGGAEPGGEPKQNLRWLWTAAQVLLWVSGVCAVLAGQYWLRRALRRKKMHSGRRNARALACWQEVRRMARLTSQTPPQELEALAEKAKFSQHTLTAAELLEFALWLEQARRLLEERPWIVRLAIRLIWAVE